MLEGCLMAPMSDTTARNIVIESTCSGAVLVVRYWKIALIPGLAMAKWPLHFELPSCTTMAL